MLVKFKLNGRSVEANVNADDFLLDVLKKFGLLSLKRGCDTSNCGICSVWVDEKVVLSCTYLAVRANGKNISTLEGVEVESKALKKHLAAQGAEQCGYCAAGLIMTVLAMEKELEKPTDDEIEHFLNGNLCRCTGYQGQLRAISSYINEVKK